MEKRFRNRNTLQLDRWSVERSPLAGKKSQRNTKEKYLNLKKARKELAKMSASTKGRVPWNKGVKNTKPISEETLRMAALKQWKDGRGLNKIKRL